MIPARAFCEVCNLREVNDYFDLPDTGTVKTFTISNINWDSSFLPDGKVNIFAVIEIDGAGEDMGLIHKLGEVDRKDVKVGMKVKAVWKKASERTGNVLDLDYFRPMKDGEDKDLKPVRVKPSELDVESGKAFPGKIPLFYRYTAGLAGEKFYSDLAKGTLSGTKCKENGNVYVPPAAFCEDCMCSLDPVKDAEEIDPKSGMIIGFTTVYEDRSGHELDAPKVIVQVAYPNAVGSVFGTLEVADPEDAEIGMLVELVASKKVGPDNIAFKPLK
ncbi:MAG: OB-fold domain-containing protein [Myxococcota bacterium]|nr:OB-fold domain-containing protein [Myxococcota bacterium]